MKGITGIIVAIGLGIVGALANSSICTTRPRRSKRCPSSASRRASSSASGDRLPEENLVEVKIPKNYVGNLADYAFQWKALKTVVNDPVWRALDSREGSVLLMQSDLKTPPKALELGKGEIAACVPVAARNFVAAQINPGDKVSFKFWNAATPPAPTRAVREGSRRRKGTADPPPKAEEPETPAEPPAPSEVIGPFIVKSVGNRLGSAEVMKAAKIPQVQENVLVIRVSKNEPGELERYEKLFARLHKPRPAVTTSCWSAKNEVASSRPEQAHAVPAEEDLPELRKLVPAYGVFQPA